MGSVGAERGRGLAWVGAAYLSALAVALAVGVAVRQHHPILVAAAADLAATVVVFLFSARLDNSSVYDPYWSVAPIPVVLYWAAAARAGDPAAHLRALAVVLLVCVWGGRLTANWALRWRGLRDEDFRYLEIRRRTGRWYWPASLVSIHLLPTAWVFLGLLPTYPALVGPGRAPGALAALAFAVTTCAIAVEATADRQLRAFLRRRTRPGDVLESGLWARSRHPNYFGEVLFWWGLFLFGLSADPRWSWTVVGPVAITLLFLLVSVPWMDRRMAERHPRWRERMRDTSALVPWWPRPGA